MFVCLCNALTDKDICAAARTCSRVSDVYRCHGCTAQCGKCASYIRDALRGAGEAPGATVTTAVALGAEA